MSGVNKVIIVGRLGGDPEVKTISTGNTVANFTIATSENWNDKEGQAREKTEWHRIVAWGKTADLAGKYLSKGRQVYIEGRLQTRSWEDDKGQKRYTTEIICKSMQFLGSKNDGAGTTTTTTTNTEDFGPEPQFNSSEDLPF